MVSVTDPVLLVLPTITFPKERVVLERETGGQPFPVKPIVCGLSEALSEIVIAPVRVPSIVGVNVILILHFFPGRIELPQVFVCEKSPLATMPVKVSEALPVLDNVAVFALLVVETTWFPKLKLVGEIVTVCAKLERLRANNHARKKIIHAAIRPNSNGALTRTAARNFIPQPLSTLS